MSAQVYQVSAQQGLVTSTTSTMRTEIPPNLPENPADWSIENVIAYVLHSYPNLIKYADLLRQHKINGKAFLLVNPNKLMFDMGLKVGPALKLHHLAWKIKNPRRHYTIIY